MEIRKTDGSRLRKGLSERQTAYALILPAMLVIFAVAVFPLLQTFYISLFDLRLNHPTRNARHFVHKLNLEQYVDMTDRGRSALASLSDSDVSDDVLRRLPAIGETLDRLHDTLVSNPDRLDQYERVRDLVVTFEPVRESSLRYFRISGLEANEALSLAEQLQDDVARAIAATRESPSRQLRVLEQISQDVGRSIVYPNFIGLGHYAAHFADTRLWSSLINTMTFVGFAVLFELVFGMLIALLINRKFLGRGAIRATVLIPWSIPAAVSALIWRYMYDGQFGIVARALDAVGLIGDSSVMLSTGSGAMVSLIVADIWKTTPFMALLLLGGLQTIDGTLYESARVDGARSYQQFFRITLPLLKNTMMVAIIFRSLDTFKVFDLVYVLTAGGPANATETLSVFAYRLMFRQMNFGSGSAVAVVVFICITLLSVVYVKALDSDMLTGHK